jgi:hypothetical protein
MSAELHLAKDSFALHPLLQHFEGLVYIVVTNENLHEVFLFDRAIEGRMGGLIERSETHLVFRQGTYESFPRFSAYVIQPFTDSLAA